MPSLSLFVCATEQTFINQPDATVLPGVKVEISNNIGCISGLSPVVDPRVRLSLFLGLRVMNLAFSVEHPKPRHANPTIDQVLINKVNTLGETQIPVLG